MAGYDVLVVGGGLGGLACALDLARAGRRVCVLEAQAVAGGYAANFDRGRYRFDASLHMLDGLGPGGANRPIWEHLGLHRHVPTRQPDLIRRELWPDHDLHIGQGLDAWIDAIGGAFPEDRAGLRRVADLALDVHRAVVDDRDARLANAPPPPLLPPLSDLMDRTAGPVLRDHLTHPRAVSVAGSLSCYLGLGCDEIAAIPFFTMLASYHHDGGSYPVGGSGAIAAALCAELADAGAEVRLGTAVAAIRTRRRVAVGVTLATGEHLDAPVVVSNIAPAHTYGTLIAEDEVPTRFLRKLRDMSVGTSVIKIWLGFDRDPCPADVPYETFLRTAYGTTFCDGTLEDIGVVAPHRLDPACAPEGGAVIAITAGAEALLCDDDTQRYKDLAEVAVCEVERRLIPGLGDAEEKVVATPRTFHRYTANPGGTIHGFRPIPSQSGPRRLGITGPIGGLYHVGGWTYAGSGFLPSMVSGLIASASIQGVPR